VAKRGFEQGKTVDMEALEQGMREAALRDGAKAFSGLIAQMPDCQGEVVCPECRQFMRSLGKREKELVSLLGAGIIERTYYECTRTGCNSHRFPKDELLDISKTGFSPGVRRLMARSGSHDSFEAGRMDLKDYSGIEVSAKDVERVSEAIGEAIEQKQIIERPKILAQKPSPRIDAKIPIMYAQCDGTGVPMVTCEIEGRKGKQEDGTAKTREAKLGCVFTQITTDNSGHPVREPNSTTYVGAIETAAEFSLRLEAEAIHRGLWQAKTIVFLGDGAKWVWNLADQHFFGAIQIVDFFHASEHLHKLLVLLFPAPDKFKEQEPIWRSWLDTGEITKIITSAKNLLFDSGETQKKVEQEIGYFEENVQRMRYAEYKEKGLFIGSGVIEAGCKSIIGKRLKQSGMRWSLRGANSIIALRCCEISRRFDEFWENRAAV
jgi:hypothetical protein